MTGVENTTHLSKYLRGVNKPPPVKHSTTMDRAHMTRETTYYMAKESTYDSDPKEHEEQ